MNTPNRVPYIPDSAPFSEEQRQWLNGFLAGLFSDAALDPVGAAAPAALPPAPAKQPVLILFGSQTGNAEGLAKKLNAEAGKRGYAPALTDMAKFDAATLAAHTNLLIVTSTWGEGDPPDNALGFWERLKADDHPRLEGVRYSVLALGDHNYEDFCGCGRRFDERLSTLGAQRLHPRQDCDTDYDEPAKAWMGGVLDALAGTPDTAKGHHDEALHMDPGAKELASKGEKMRSDTIVPPPGSVGNGGGSTQTATVAATTALAKAGVAAGAFSKANPFPARLLTNRRLTHAESAKDTRHYEICLKGSGLTYEVGDALGVVPMNSPELVDEVLAALGFDGEEEVTGSDGVTKKPIRLALISDYQIRAPHKEFLIAVAERDEANTYLRDLLNPTVRTELDMYLFGREIIDVLLDSAKLGFAPEEFVKLLRKLQPRLYSIASSFKAHPEQVHLTVDTLRYEAHGRQRHGVSSTFLAERVTESTRIPVFVQVAKHFRPPEKPDVPMIMVGPGTGIAPFRAFLQERRATGAVGKNWLYFGARTAAQDFFYKEELEDMQAMGSLHHLTTAFSRDQKPAVYVQHRMRENAAEMWKWLQEGAHFYVCGDAKNMAKDVDLALHAIAQEAGGLSEDNAKEYVSAMRKDKRYQRDVY